MKGLEPSTFCMASRAEKNDARRPTAPARIYDLRSTFISNALASGLTVCEIARVAGTSAKMIERHYGALLDSVHEPLLERLESRAGS